MMENNIQQVQTLFLQWIRQNQHVRFPQIKDICKYLNVKYDLDNPYALYSIFYPLFQSGLIDYCGDNCYAPSPVFYLKANERILTNSITDSGTPTGWLGFKYATANASALSYTPSLVLGSMSTVDKIVIQYEVGLLDIDSFKKNVGIVKEPKVQYVNYFILKSKGMLVKIPSMADNPDARNVALTYESILLGKKNYCYAEDSSTLRVYRYGIPILIYRVLLAESLLAGFCPKLDKGFIIFQGISRNTIKQLNRILIKSIVNE